DRPRAVTVTVDRAHWPQRSRNASSDKPISDLGALRQPCIFMASVSILASRAARAALAPKRRRSREIAPKQRQRGACPSYPLQKGATLMNTAVFDNAFTGRDQSGQPEMARAKKGFLSVRTVALLDRVTLIGIALKHAEARRLVVERARVGAVRLGICVV